MYFVGGIETPMCTDLICFDNIPKNGKWYMNDIIIKTSDYIFSYRVAGLVIQNGLILVQKPANGTGFSFPGGHVSFGETNEETLVREFGEEIGAEVKVNDLKWIGEIFFPWGDRPCHQLCLYYMVDILTQEIPKRGMFYATESLDGDSLGLEFHWVAIRDIQDVEIYPENAKKLIGQIDEGPKHFVYKES